jgi:predicted acyl esterase
MGRGSDGTPESGRDYPTGAVTSAGAATGAGVAATTLIAFATPSPVALTRSATALTGSSVRIAAPSSSSTAAYEVDSASPLVSSVLRLDVETTLVGYPEAHLWVEADGADDADLFVLVQKLDRHGTPLQQFTIPNHGAQVQDLTERGASVLRYRGSNGRRRVSARHLDDALSTDAVPRAHLRPGREAITR